MRFNLRNYDKIIIFFILYNILKINYYNYIIKGKIFVKWERDKVEARRVEIKEVISKQISNQMDLVILKEDNIKEITIQAIS